MYDKKYTVTLFSQVIKKCLQNTCHVKYKIRRWYFLEEKPRKWEVIANAFNRYWFFKTTFELQLVFKEKLYKYHIKSYQSFLQRCAHSRKGPYMCLTPLFSIHLCRSHITFLCCFWNEATRKKKHGCRESPWRRMTTVLVPRYNVATLVGLVMSALFHFLQTLATSPLDLVEAGMWDCLQNIRLSIILQECKHLFQHSVAEVSVSYWKHMWWKEI